MTVHRPTRFVIYALVFAALTAALPLAQAGDNRQDKIREAAAQSVKAGKVFDSIMKTPDKAIPQDRLHTRKPLPCSRESLRQPS